MLGVLVAVVAVVVGATAASGWRGGPADASATGSTGRPPMSVAVPGPVSPPAPGSLAAALPDPPAAASDPSVASLAGELVVESGELRVERLTLADASTIYRVTITAGPYVVRDMPAIISADGRALGVATESVDLSSLVLHTTDAAVTTPGTTVALTYGLPGAADVDWSATVEVAA